MGKLPISLCALWAVLRTNSPVVQHHDVALLMPLDDCVVPDNTTYEIDIVHVHGNTVSVRCVVPEEITVSPVVQSLKHHEYFVTNVDEPREPAV
jgi:hypothetical protein